MASSTRKKTRTGPETSSILGEKTRKWHSVKNRPVQLKFCYLFFVVLFTIAS